MREHGSIKRKECQQLFKITEIQARYLLRKMERDGMLSLKGSGRGARYVLR
ncbi:MAG: FaeA/PapI family transcriptional regulator [bacterium]